MGHVIVIGGGASGMMAAISASYHGAEVTIVEHMERIGKKLLSTGNGKCNFTNARQSPEFYLSENGDFAWKIVSRFGQKETCALFQELGVYPKERNGYYYPYSGQASSVLDALRMELARLGVGIRTGQECVGVIPKKSGFCVKLADGELVGDKVVLAAGSKAAAKTGSDGSGYRLAKALGHHVITPLPALVQLKCAEDFYKGIAGVRIQGTVSIYAGSRNETKKGLCQNVLDKGGREKRFLASDQGEIQLTTYGISGIPVFQVSRYAAKALHEGENVMARMDFMPELSQEGLLDALARRALDRPQKKAEDFLTGMFPGKLNALWLRLSGIERMTAAGALSPTALRALVRAIKQFETRVVATNSYGQAQVCRGGVDTREVDAGTLESQKVPGLYFAGEILDVDGPCGGYNLQWAWSSGYVAGKEAANHASSESVKHGTGTR